MELSKINSVYKAASFFDGFFDGQTVEFNKYRHHWNSFVFITMRIVAVFHLVIFITDDPSLKNELIYFRFSKDFGSRYLNLGKILFCPRIAQL